jgi:hypothetical protein
MWRYGLHYCRIQFSMVFEALKMEVNIPICKSAPLSTSSLQMCQSVHINAQNFHCHCLNNLQLHLWQVLLWPHKWPHPKVVTTVSFNSETNCIVYQGINYYSLAFSIWKQALLIKWQKHRTDLLDIQCYKIPPDSTIYTDHIQTKEGLFTVQIYENCSDETHFSHRWLCCCVHDISNYKLCSRINALQQMRTAWHN